MNVHCYIHYCKWLLQDYRNIERAKQVIQQSNKISNLDNELLSTMLCSHGDTFRRIYKYIVKESDADSSIKYYLLAISQNNTDSHVQFGLSKIILKMLQTNNFQMNVVKNYTSFDPMNYLVNLFIKAMFMANKNVHYISSFITAMKELLCRAEYESYRRFLTCDEKIELTETENFELIRKWNHLIDLHRDPKTYFHSSIQNNQDKSLAAYIYAIASLVNFMNRGGARDASVQLAKSILADQVALYRLTYFYKAKEGYHFTTPSLLEDSDATIQVFAVDQQRFQNVQFVKVNLKNVSVMKLYIAGDGIHCETF